MSSSTKPVFLSHLREALINVGFFYLENPPISQRVQHIFLEQALNLFHLPLEKKLEIEMVNSPHFLGYSRLGAEITALKQDYREQFDVGFDSSPNYKSYSFQLSSQLNYQHPEKMSHCIEIFTVLTRYVLGLPVSVAVFIAYILV